MNTLFGFEHDGTWFEVRGSNWTGIEHLHADGVEVARQRNFRYSSEFVFEHARQGTLRLAFRIDFPNACVHYTLCRGDATLKAESLPIRAAGDGAAQAESPLPLAAEAGAATPARTSHGAAWVGLAAKLFKGGTVLKATLAGMAVTGWTVLFSLEFALVLIAILVFHEWGHLRAMRRFGIPTKGMYLIPFVGGIAVGERARTHWQDVVIALMGPLYGLALTVLCYLLFLVTSNHTIGLAASLGALINVFNLLPIHPLDGGRVIKALVFSSRRRGAFLAVMAFSAACLAASITLGLTLLSFFVVLGALDLLFGWRDIRADTKEPLNGSGMLISAGAYVLTIAAFVVIISLVAASALPGSEIATRLLRS